MISVSVKSLQTMRGVLSVDVEAMERVESELDRIVEKRAREAGDAAARTRTSYGEASRFLERGAPGEGFGLEERGEGAAVMT